MSFLSSHRLLIFLLFLCFSFVAIAQTEVTSNADGTKEVEIINADYLKMQEVNGVKYTRLVGNVHLRQDAILMWCDSASINKEDNSVDAWGRVHIAQDTINAYSQTLHHDGNKKFSRMEGNARLNNGSMTLYTDVLYYDVKQKVSYYLTGGRVLKDSTVITSVKGYYYDNTSEVYFRDSVEITDPDYHLTSDTLKYHTRTKLSTFFGNTRIDNAESTIYCDNGWFDSENDVSSFGRNTLVDNPPQQLFTDSLYYLRNSGYGKVIGTFQWIDTSMGTEIHGKFAEYFDSLQYLMATQHPLLIYKMDKDSLFLVADTLKSRNISATDTTKIFFAYHHVRMFMKDMQGVCDSLYYSFADSTFRMYYDPVMWTETTQMSGDTMTLLTKDRKAEKLSIYHSGFIISPSGKKYYDQIKGTNMFGYFIDNELDHLDVIGNAESLYFGKDEKDKYIGANRAVSANITMYFKDKKIDKIVFIRKPEAVFTPMKKLTADEKLLKNFRWQIDRKPKSRKELIEE